MSWSLDGMCERQGLGLVELSKAENSRYFAMGRKTSLRILEVCSVVSREPNYLSSERRKRDGRL